MELSFKDLSKREVVNVVDGKSLGHIVDINLSFPKGVLIGITVPSKKSIFNIFKLYEKVYIESYKIKKIGTDVVLVDLNAIKPIKPPKPINPCNPCGNNYGKNPMFTTEYPDGEYE